MDEAQGDRQASRGARSLSAAENLARIAIAAQAISNAADNTLRARKSMIGLADWALLHRLSLEQQPQSMGKMALQMGVTRQRIQKQLDQLAQIGLVDIRIAGDDKRVRTVNLTKPGRDTLAATSKQWSESLANSEPLQQFKNLDGLRQRMSNISILLARMARIEVTATSAEEIGPARQVPRDSQVRTSTRLPEKGPA